MTGPEDQKRSAQQSAIDAPVEAGTLVEGRLSLHHRGFGFLQVAAGVRHFVPPPQLEGYLEGDLCRGTLAIDRQGRSSVRSLELLERKRQFLIGRARKADKGWTLELDPELGRGLWTLQEGKCKLSEGSWTLARMRRGRELRARQVYLDKSSPELDIARVVARMDLPLEFPKAVREEARKLDVRIGEAHLRNRRDLRFITTITVDAPSTRDIDDAISVLPADDRGGLRILVSIADVAEFVSPGSALDKEARARATSVYLTGRVLPMYPFELSDQALSLLPGEDRLTLTAELRIDPEGQITAVDIYESIIRSVARVTYSEAYEILRGRARHEIQAVDEAFRWFRTALARLDLQRRRRGGYENPHVEPKIELDDEGEATDIVAREQNAAHRMIERFMVAANEAVAAWMLARGLPTLYRQHAPPSPERVRDLIRFARNFGVEAGFNENESLSPTALAAFVEQARGADWGPAFFSVLTRSLGKARYGPQPIGHFGLASSAYLHFTSPIRRYADGLVHRNVKAYLRGQRAGFHDDLQSLSDQILECELRASRAERAHQRYVWARYMASRVNEVFDGHIVGVQPFGLFVQLLRSRVEGLLPIEALGAGRLEFDEATLTLRGPQRIYEIGQALRVRVYEVDLAAGEIDFELAEPKKPRARERRR
jgi:ribonuclease R